MPPCLRCQHLKRGKRRADRDEVCVPIAQSKERSRVISVNSLARALLVAPIAELCQSSGPGMQLPEIKSPQPGVARTALAGQCHEIGNHGVGLRHELPSPGWIDLGKHSNGIQEVAQMVVVIVVDPEAKVCTGVLQPLLGDKAAPFGIIQEAIPLETAVQPRRDGGLQEPMHRGDDIGAPDLLGDQRQPRRPGNGLPVEVGGGGGDGAGSKAVNVLAQRGHDLVDPVVVDAPGGMPCWGQGVGLEDPGVADDADQVPVDAPVLEVVEHPDGAVVGEQPKVERVGEHEQIPPPLLAPRVVDAEGAVERGLPGRRVAAAVLVEDRLHGRVRQVGDPDDAGEPRRGQLRDAGLRQGDGRGGVEEEGLAAVHPEAPLGARVVAGRGLEEGVDGGDGDVDGPRGLGGGDGDEGAAADEEGAERRGEVEGDGEVVEGDDAVRLPGRGGVGRGGDGEVGGEGLDVEGRGVAARRVAEGEPGRGGADGVGVDVLGLVAVLEREVLEEAVGGERRGEQARREEAGRVGQHRGRGLREDVAARGRRRGAAPVRRHGRLRRGRGRVR
uniref:Uncharacterized protein n=1 Tax=Triticum urartu TaxID=4572 RepID=A0A8R7QF00_TRIUA